MLLELLLHPFFILHTHYECFIFYYKVFWIVYIYRQQNAKEIKAFSFLIFR